MAQPTLVGSAVAAAASSNVVDAGNASNELEVQTVTDNETLQAQAWEDRVAIVRRHFENKGYRVHSGLQFGCELVLYADDPSRVHSDFCVHVVPEDGHLDWRMMQSLVRSMPDLHKTLILANLRRIPSSKAAAAASSTTDDDINNNNNNNDDAYYEVQELAIATEHAPFRHKKIVPVGMQHKKPRLDEQENDDEEIGSDSDRKGATRVTIEVGKTRTKNEDGAVEEP